MEGRLQPAFWGGLFIGVLSALPLIGVRGWYSTNILGNRDGEVLDDPESFKTKEESKKSALDYIFQPHLYPELYNCLLYTYPSPRDFG